MVIKKKGNVVTLHYLNQTYVGNSVDSVVRCCLMRNNMWTTKQVG